jgi:peptide/nickel transport system substrate-binding protein
MARIDFNAAYGLILSTLLALGAPASAEPAHGIAMYGEPALPPDFVSLPYVNPDAPKAGRIIFGENGGFDSLNPYIVKGQSPAGLSALTVESLMGRSYAEPFTLYGLLAESIQTDEARSYVEFTLREGARFSDGSPVTPEDVLWSFEKLGTEGLPRYLDAWQKIAKSEITGPRSVMFTFDTADRELALLLGLRPILKKAQWEGKDFTLSTLEAPIGSGPYIVGDFEPGRFISYRKNPDWWGKDLPFNRGQQNFDEVRFEYFADDTARFEAFKAGELTAFRETSAVKWLNNYSYPAAQEGKIVKSEVPHQRPSGIEGLAFNVRKPLFADWRVREAFIQAFNFEFINRTITGGQLPRIQSYFSNSFLGMQPGTPAEGAVADLLKPFAADILPGTLEGYALPVTDGSESNRKGIRAALSLLEEAGWTTQDGVLKNAAGEPFAFEILLQQGTGDIVAVAEIYIETLKRLGIDARITLVDAAQYKERTNNYDFDMTHHIRALTLSPGNEQLNYWGSENGKKPGSRNWPGINSPAVDQMIAAMLAARTPEEFRDAVEALDRLLSAGRYVIPIWYADVARIAHDRRLKYPSSLPIYGDFIGFLPEVWWYED